MSLPYRLHPSAFESWQGCGKRFEFANVLRLRPSHLHPAGMNGTAVHRAIALVHREGLWDATDDQLAELYAEGFHHAVTSPIRAEDRGVPIFWGEYEDERTAVAAFAADAIDMLRGYCLDPRNRDAHVILADATWRATFGGFDWEGTLDQARQTEAGVELLDFKTSREPLSDVPRFMWPQGLTYALGMRHGVFRQVDEPEHAPWHPVSLEAVAVNWVQLREYAAYKKGGYHKDGSAYRKGDRPRGPVFYRTEVAPGMLDGHLREISLFARAVAEGRFERRPRNSTCNYECRFTEACMKQFTMKLEGVHVNAGDFDGQKG